MVDDDCKNWDYEKHPDQACVADRCRSALISLRRDGVDRAPYLKDSRPAHFSLFHGLTPEACPYMAGHYRGEDFPCLLYYAVQVGGDPRVGTLPEHVLIDLEALANRIDEVLAALDVANAAPDAQIAAEDKLIFVTEFAAMVLVEFLRIHPYANGNGHIGRFIVWTILGRYGFWPKQWPLDDRPPGPYAECLSAYRDGNHQYLVDFMLSAIAGGTTH